MEEELKRLQHMHERALRSAQRQEDSRRKRLHLSETHSEERKQLNASIERKRLAVLAKGKKQKLILKRRLAKRNQQILLTAEETAERQALIKQQRLQELKTAKQKDEERVRAKEKKMSQYAIQRKRLNERAMQRAQKIRERQSEANTQETRNIAERMEARLSKTAKMQQAVIAAIKTAKGRKNRKWKERVVFTKARPDFRAAAAQARIADKYKKIEDRKMAANTLAKHRKMLQDKLLFQKAQWAKEYNDKSALKKKPEQARIHSGSRITKNDVVHSPIRAFGEVHSASSSPALSPRPGTPGKARPASARLASGGSESKVRSPEPASKTP
eukprot:INCI622.1.p2 GENE.INCI622.1~~INCI622.1.p2  ORF type:complete len:329 (+),score=87.74 INCI622.1:404-1390(+)